MGRQRLALGFVIPLLVLAIVPSAHAASERSGRLPIGAELEVNASNGYRVSVGGSGDSAILAVSRKRSLALYSATRAHVTRTSISASFGRLGLVDVQFSPRQVRGHRPPQRRSICSFSPGTVPTRFGAFEGIVRFRGEHGYTSVSTSRAFGRVSAIPHSLCSRVGPGRAFEHLDEAPGWPTALRAVAFTEAGIVLFEAATDRFSFGRGFDHLGRFRLPKLGRRAIGFEAVAFAEEGGVGVYRLGVAAGRRGSYDFGEAPRNLRIAPPAPFSGVGRYRSCADSPLTDWSGSLAVSLPGAPRVPLANSPGGNSFAIAGATPQFTDSQCVVIPLSLSRLGT
jgi:hypothetical protein